VSAVGFAIGAKKGQNATSTLLGCAAATATATAASVLVVAEAEQWAERQRLQIASTYLE